jgi:hypothetical protein
MRLTLLIPLACLLAAAGYAAAVATAPLQHEQPNVGYRDTPLLPGSQWHVHDPDRPQPRVVTPGANNAAPSDALVLFDGKDLSHWKAGDKAAQWKVEGGVMEVNGTGSLRTVEEFGDLQLHLEWCAPAKVESASQGRGNSGVFLMGRYEVQILDSFQNRTYADGSAASMYAQYPPDVNACRAPGEWQTYDICFQAPRFEGDKLVSPARVTVVHNGVLVHHAREFLGATAHRSVAQYAAHPATGPIELQDHGNPVRYRNVWVRKL